MTTEPKPITIEPKPITGVISLNNCVQFVCDEMFSHGGINLDYISAVQSWLDDNPTLNEESDEYQEWQETFEDQPDNTWLIGDWKKDSDGKYIPDESGEYAAIVRESVVQVVWSTFTQRVRAMCSPCYPGQSDLDSGEGDILAYTLPDGYDY